MLTIITGKDGSIPIAFNHRPQRVWQQRLYCHAIKEVETTLTIKLQRRRAGGY